MNEARVLVNWVALALLSMMFLYQIECTDGSPSVHRSVTGSLPILVHVPVPVLLNIHVPHNV